MPGLGRRHQFDERSRAWPIRELLPPQPRHSQLWDCTPRLDQGTEGACVGFGWSHELAAAPFRHNATAADALALYRRAKQLDQWAGEDYEGTSVLAGAKAVKELGFMPEYRWAFTMDDVLDTISFHGPVVIGINWYEMMLWPDRDAMVYPKGQVVGGHCILVRGVAVVRETVRLRNSWGVRWGDFGDCKLRFEDLERLLAEDGECVVPVVRT